MEDAPDAPGSPDDVEISVSCMSHSLSAFIPSDTPLQSPPVTPRLPTGLSPMVSPLLSPFAMTLCIGPLAGPASAPADNGQEDVDMVSPPVTPVSRLRRQFAWTTPSPSAARFGFAAPAPSSAPVTPAVPLPLASTAAPAVAALPQTPAQVTTTTKAPAPQRRFRPNGRRSRPAPTADRPPQTPAPSLTPASASVCDVIAQSLAPAKGPAQDACAPVHPPASTQSRTMSTAAQSQNSGGVAPSLPKAPSNAAIQHGNSTAAPPAPKKPRRPRVIGSKGTHRMGNHGPLAGSLVPPNVEKDGPANSTAVNSEAPTTTVADLSPALVPQQTLSNAQEQQMSNVTNGAETLSAVSSNCLPSSASTAVAGSSDPAAPQATRGGPSVEAQPIDPLPGVSQVPLSSGAAVPTDSNGNEKITASAEASSNESNDPHDSHESHGEPKESGDSEDSHASEGNDASKETDDPDNCEGSKESKEPDTDTAMSNDSKEPDGPDSQGSDEAREPEDTAMNDQPDESHQAGESDDSDDSEDSDNSDDSGDSDDSDDPEDTEVFDQSKWPVSGSDLATFIVEELTPEVVRQLDALLARSMPTSEAARTEDQHRIIAITGDADAAVFASIDLTDNAFLTSPRIFRRWILNFFYGTGGLMVDEGKVPSHYARSSVKRRIFQAIQAMCARYAALPSDFNVP
jgi:hypothetical protein